MTITLTPRTMQDVFDVAVTRLFDGTGPAMKINNDYLSTCYYRDPDTGLACAVGAMISDDEYDPNVLETHDIRELIENEDVVLIINGDDDDGQTYIETIFLLEELQSAHDNRTHWNGNHLSKAGVKCLQRIAYLYDLDTLLLDAYAFGDE